MGNRHQANKTCYCPVPYIGSGHELTPKIQEVLLLNCASASPLPPDTPPPAFLPAFCVGPIACQYLTTTKESFIAATHYQFTHLRRFLIDGNKLFLLIDYIVKSHKTRDDKAVATATID